RSAAARAARRACSPDRAPDGRRSSRTDLRRTSLSPANSIRNSIKQNYRLCKPVGEPMPASRDVAQYLRGAACGLAAVCIWSGWIVVARLGLRTSLTPWDIAAIRFGVAGLLMLPLVAAKGLAVDRLGWPGLAAIVLGGAAPVFLANSGL